MANRAANFHRREWSWGKRLLNDQSKKTMCAAYLGNSLAAGSGLPGSTLLPGLFIVVVNKRENSKAVEGFLNQMDKCAAPFP